MAAKLEAAIKAKVGHEEVLAILKEAAENEENEDAKLLGVHVFVQTLLNLASKSFSHSFAAIAKFHPTLKQIGSDSEDAQMAVLKALGDIWHNHQQMNVIIVDKLLKTQIVECAAVANWIFSKDMVGEFTKVYIWEILHLTIRKMNKHVNKLNKEANDARKMIEDNSSDMESDGGHSGDSDDGGKRNKKSSSSLAPDAEKPTEEQVERLEERLEAAQADQKNLFLIIFQVKFVDVVFTRPGGNFGLICRNESLFELILTAASCTY